MSKVTIYGKQVNIEKGCTISCECLFGDRVWKVANVVEKKNEVFIHCHNGRIFKTVNRELDFRPLRLVEIWDKKDINIWSCV